MLRVGTGARKAARARLVDNIATGLAQVSKDDVVVRSYFRSADPDYGARVERGVKEKKG